MVEKRFFIYGRASCSFCVAAVNFCSASKKQYYFLDYEEDRAALEEAKEFYSMATVPIILSNDTETGATKKVGGYTDLLEFLN